MAKPFAISEQYKANMVEPEVAESAEANSSLKPPSKKQKVSESGVKPSKRKQSTMAPKMAPPAEPVPGSCDTSTVYSPQDYSAKRFEFIQKLKDEGVSFGDAKERWNDSALKKALLSTLSVSELVRRRFCPKGTTTNPWA